MMKYIDKLKELSLKENDITNKIQSLDAEKNEEIKKIVADIEEKYAEKLKKQRTDVSLVRCEMDLIISKMTEASLFDINEIGPVMAKIMSKKENKEYKFYSMDLDGHFSYIISSVNEEKVSDRECFVFSERITDGRYVGFYNYYILQLPINFGKFGYLKDFIDMVVEYRLDNIHEVKNLNVSELESLMNEFLDEKSRKLDLS